MHLSSLNKRAHFFPSFVSCTPVFPRRATGDRRQIDGLIACLIAQAHDNVSVRCRQDGSRVSAKQDRQKTDTGYCDVSRQLAAVFCDSSCVECLVWSIITGSNHTTLLIAGTGGSINNIATPKTRKTVMLQRTNIFDLCLIEVTGLIPNCMYALFLSAHNVSPLDAKEDNGATNYQNLHQLYKQNC